MRIVLLGNAGAGKSRMARRLAAARHLPILSLDEIAWEAGTQRRPLESSLRELRRFLDEHDAWVIEGCYGDLVEHTLPACTELRFLNPGVEACVEHCRMRPWEPDKFASREQQDAALESLIDWVREYEARGDEYGLARHRALFQGFDGPKREITTGLANDEA